MSLVILWIVLVALAAAAAAVTISLVRRPMHRMLGANRRLSPTRDFYVRALGLVLTFAALAAIAGAPMPSSEDRASWQPMEFVWWTADRLEPALWSIAFFSLGYVVILSVLYMVLGRYRDE